MISRLYRFAVAIVALMLPLSLIAARDTNNNTTNQKNDPVIVWNQVALEIMKKTDLAPAQVARNLAILHLAIFDAVNLVEQKYAPYTENLRMNVNPDASEDAAAIAAGHRVLTTLFPMELTFIDERMKGLFTAIPEGDSRKDGIELGRQVAKEILASRNKDNSDRNLKFKSTPKAGNWQPNPGDQRNSLLPHWSGVTPFALNTGSQFRPEAPSAPNSAQHVLEVEQVQKLGGRDSTARTPEQTAIALYWDVDVPIFWNIVAEQVVQQKRMSLVDEARAFALLNVALADAGIATWDAKYRFNSWRPVTAITQGEKSTNPIKTDPNWQPLIQSRAAPEYVSAHGAYSGAASQVLRTLFGDNQRFSVNSDNPKTAGARSFSSFTQAAEESGMSRVYGGIHFISSNQEGLKIGRAVADHTLDVILIQNDAPQSSGSR